MYALRVLQDHGITSNALHSKNVVEFLKFRLEPWINKFQVTIFVPFFFN